jgi:hypothetical protein
LESKKPFLFADSGSSGDFAVSYILFAFQQPFVVLTVHLIAEETIFHKVSKFNHDFQN